MGREGEGIRAKGEDERDRETITRTHSNLHSKDRQTGREGKKGKGWDTYRKGFAEGKKETDTYIRRKKDIEKGRETVT